MSHLLPLVMLLDKILLGKGDTVFSSNVRNTAVMLNAFFEAEMSLQLKSGLHYELSQKARLT